MLQSFRIADSVCGNQQIQAILTFQRNLDLSDYLKDRTWPLIRHIHQILQLFQLSSLGPRVRLRKICKLTLVIRNDKDHR